MSDWTARFWSKVDKSGSCWLWVAGKDDKGYGQFSIGFKKIKPHRLSYEMANGPIPEGLLIDHRCHVKACIRPSHLRPVTQKQNQENVADKPPRALSGARGVRKKPGNKWGVYVTHNQETHYGGTFTDVNEAAEAAKQLRLSLFSHNDLDRKSA